MNILQLQGAFIVGLLTYCAVKLTQIHIFLELLK